MWAAPDKGGYEVIDGMLAFDFMGFPMVSEMFDDCELEFVRQIMEG